MLRPKCSLCTRINGDCSYPSKRKSPTFKHKINRRQQTRDNETSRSEQIGETISLKVEIVLKNPRQVDRNGSPHEQQGLWHREYTIPSDAAKRNDIYDILEALGIICNSNDRDNSSHAVVQCSD